MSDVSASTATLESPAVELPVKDHLRGALERELAGTRAAATRFSETTAPPFGENGASRFTDTAPPRVSAFEASRFTDTAPPRFSEAQVTGFSEATSTHARQSSRFGDFG